MAETMPQPYTQPQDYILGERTTRINLEEEIRKTIAAQDPAELARIREKHGGSREGNYDLQAEQLTIAALNEGEIFEGVYAAAEITDYEDNVDFFLQFGDMTIGVDYTETDDQNRIMEKIANVYVNSCEPLKTMPQLGVIPRLVIYSPKGTFKGTATPKEVSEGKSPLPDPHRLAKVWFEQMVGQLTALADKRPEHRPLYIKARSGLKRARDKYFERVIEIRKQAA